MRKRPAESSLSHLCTLQWPIPRTLRWLKRCHWLRRFGICPTNRADIQIVAHHSGDAPRFQRDQSSRCDTSVTAGDVQNGAVQRREREPAFCSGDKNQLLSRPTVRLRLTTFPSPNSCRRHSSAP